MTKRPRGNKGGIKPDRFVDFFLVAIKLGALFFAIACVIHVLPTDHHSVVQFTWRWQSIINIGIITLMLSLLYVLNRPQNRSRISLWFSLYVLPLAVSQVGLLLSASATSISTY